MLVLTCVLSLTVIVVLTLICHDYHRAKLKADQALAEIQKVASHIITVRCRLCEYRSDKEKRIIVEWLKDRRGPVLCGSCGTEITADVMAHPFVANAMHELQLVTMRNEEALKTLHHLLGPPPAPALEAKSPDERKVNKPEVMQEAPHPKGSASSMAARGQVYTIISSGLVK